MNHKILCVDDEPNVLVGYQRALRKIYQIDVAEGGEAALQAITEQGPYAVIVSDMRMPGMDGVQFLSRIREVAPESVRVMLTGNVDQQTALEAVNEGHIFRFLTKPCPTEVLAKTLQLGIEQYHLVRAEKELLENTLSGSLQVMTDILSLVNPAAFGRAARVKRFATQIMSVLKVENAWQTEIAAMLSQIGCITIPAEVLHKVYEGKQINAAELKMLQNCPQVGHDLICRIPRLEPVADIIAYQEKRFNGSGLPGDAICGEDIPIGARILKAALDYDKLLVSLFSHSEALEEMEQRAGWYDPQVLEALHATLDTETEFEEKMLSIRELQPHMILAEDIVSTFGGLLIPNGHEITNSLCLRLSNYARGAIKEPIKVMVPKLRAGGGACEAQQQQLLHI